MKKALIAFLLVALILTSIVIVYSSSKIKIESNGIDTNAGQSFEIPIYLKNNSGISALSIDLDYDSELLTFASAKNGNVFSDEEFSVSNANSRINWINSEMSNITQDGILANISFSVNLDCPTTSSLIRLNITQAFNEDFDDVEIETSEINVNIQGVDKKVKSIKVEQPSKLTYKTGDSFDSTGMKVLAKYDDNSELDVTTKAQVSELDTSTTGTKIVKVSYKGFVSSFAVKVLPNENILDLKVDSNSCEAGKTVSVPIKIVNNPGIAGVSFDVVYDNEKITLNSVSNGEVFEKNNMTVGGNTGTSPYTVLWENGKSKTNNEKNGLLLTLAFSIKDDAEAGEYDIAISNVQAIDKDLNAVESYVENGKLPMYSHKYLLGDTNANGYLDLRDATVIQMYLAGYDKSKYGTLDTIAADCDESGDLSIKDVTTIQKILVGLIIDDKYETFKYS